MLHYIHLCLGRHRQSGHPGVDGSICQYERNRTGVKWFYFSAYPALATNAASDASTAPLLVGCLSDSDTIFALTAVGR